MNKIGETITHVIFLDFFQGTPIRFLQTKATGEITIHAEDAAKVLGFNNLEDMMSDNAVLDLLNDYKKENPYEPFPVQEIKR